MRDVPKPLFVAFGVYLAVVSALMSVLILVVGVMFVVLGNTPGRLIGVGLLAFLLIPWLRAGIVAARRSRHTA